MNLNLTFQLSHLTFTNGLQSGSCYFNVSVNLKFIPQKYSTSMQSLTHKKLMCLFVDAWMVF